MSTSPTLLSGRRDAVSSRLSSVTLLDPEALSSAPVFVEFLAPTSGPPELPQGGGVPDPSAKQYVFAPIAASTARCALTRPKPK
jgi:hypothetical protein